MPGPGSVAVPKPLSRKAERARETRAARAIVQQVRAACVERDGHCRVWSATTLFGPCDVYSTWAHIGDLRRFKTRGLPAEQRHTTAGTLMLCETHHRMYDVDKTLTIEPLTELGAESTLRLRVGGVCVLSIPRRPQDAL